MKINVVGTSGSGKSTVSKQLAHALLLPYIELDLLFWRPGWQETPDDEFQCKIATALASASDQSGGWVLDGNYTRTKHVKWQDVDVVVWIDYPFWRTLWQAVRRAVRRAWTGQELWPGTGNKETWSELLLSRKSILVWTITTYRLNRRRYEADMRDRAWEHIRFIRVTHPSQVQGVIKELKRAKG